MNKKKGIIIAAVAAAVLIAVVLLLIFIPKGGSSQQAATFDEGTAMELSVDKDGVHQAVVKLDSNGNIPNNSFGTLMEYYPADISSIHVENTKGAFDVQSTTPKGEATVYTIKGFEDFDLQGGNPDLIASAAASLSFSKVATLDADKAKEFGFDKPRSTVTVSYSDKTKAIITIGDDAPQQAGTYIKFGTGNAVYVADTETVAAFDYGVTDLISLTVNKPADSADNNQLSSVTLSGAGFAKEITLVPNTNENYYASYRMTAPMERLANENETSLVTGGIRGLYALSVKMVNPSEAQLKELGLAAPNARLVAVYPDTTVELSATKPDKDGNVYLMADGKKVVYQISADKVAWAKTSLDKLCYEYALYPKMTKLTDVSVKSGGKTYDFALATKESVTTDDQGSETSATVTTVTYNKKEIETGSFGTFYDALTLIPMADSKADSGSGTEVLTAAYTYSDGSSDTVAFLNTGSDAYLVKLNGTALGHCSKADVTHAAKALSEVVK